MVTLQPSAKAGLLLAITVCGILPMAVFLAVPASHGMIRFGTYEELQRFLLIESRCGSLPSPSYGLATPVPALGPAGSGANQYSRANNQAESSSTTVNAVPSHSETNNQVGGVDELDTVKNDGQYIYTVANNTVAIVDAYPTSQAKLASRIIVQNQTIEGIFLDGNVLSVITRPGTYYGYVACGGPMMALSPSTTIASCYECYRNPVAENTNVLVYDLADHSRPILQSSVTVDGSFVGARRIGNIVYVVSSSPARYNQTLPVIVINGQKTLTSATQIYHSDVQDQAFSYTTILGLNVAQTNTSPNIQTFLLGTSSTIYVSSTNIFLTQPVWDSSMGTVVHRISIANSTISYEASGTVWGHVLNQFSMDESNGFFRVATSNDGWSGGLQTNVYVLDESMRTIGRLEGISPGEKLYAARFMRDRAYLVTFKRLDPLFVLDLSTPSRPSLLGQLNVTGVSDYLQPYDTTHLIGIGKSAQDVAWENAALFLGLKISLFDVTNPNRPTDLSDYTVGDRGTDSPALTDQKAVLFDRSVNLLAIPILVVGGTDPKPAPAYGQPTFQGAFVFQVTVDHGIVLRGTITHFPSSVQPSSYYAYNSAYFVTRSLYIGNVLYTISPAMIKMNSLSDLSEMGSVPLM